MPKPPSPHDLDRVLMPAFLAACPSLEQNWPELQVRWNTVFTAPRAPDDWGIAYDLGVLAHHLVWLLETGETAEFPNVFAVVERVLRDGDDATRYPVQVGLLEDIGTIAAGQGGWPFAARFRAWFGPETAAAWDELQQLRTQIPR